MSKRRKKQPFIAQRLAKPEDMSPLHENEYDSGIGEPEAVTIHGLFLNGVNGKWPCLLCDCPTETPPFATPGNDHTSWESPDNPPEITLHFNAFQTALVNTAVLAIARLMGKPALQEIRLDGLCEILRLFLRTEAAVGTRIWDEWKSRIDRGKVENCNWVKVVDTPATEGQPIQVNATPVNESGEPVTATMREESSGNVDVDDNADGLYVDSDGEMYVSERDTNGNA